MCEELGGVGSWGVVRRQKMGSVVFCISECPPVPSTEPTHSRCLRKHIFCSMKARVVELKAKLT